MTIETTTSRVQYDTNGTTGPWTVPFYFLEDGDLLVTYADSDGLETTLVLTTDYTATGAGVPAGGTVTTVSSYVAGGTLTITRNVAALQEVDYVETDSFPAETHETALDRLTMLAQQLIESIRRCIRFPSSYNLDAELPTVSLRAEKLIGLDSDGALTTYDLLDGAAGDAAETVFIQSGTGAVGRTVQAKEREVLSVADFATYDGVTDDTTKVTQAVAEAVARGTDLYWPDGSALTTANIPLLHTVRHRGPGAIVRGASTFYPDPTSGRTNTLYLAASGGSSSNDGLTASQPIDTLTNVWAAVANYGPHLAGKWKIQHAAGTYSGYHRVPYQLTSEKMVELLGPDVSGHPNVPTAIYDNNAAANKVVSCINPGMKIKVKDIKVRECEATAIEMSGGLLFCENVHTLDCEIGIGCYGGDLYVSGGIHEVSAGYLTGYARIQSMFNNKHTIGYSVNETTGNPTQDASISACPQITAGNASGRGIHLQEGATGHIYAKISGFSKGLEVFSRSRANLDTTDFRNNSVAVEVEHGCDTDGTPVFNKGTGTANTVSIRRIGGGIDYQAYPSPGAALEYRVAQDLTGETVTGTTAAEQIGGTLYTLSGQDFDEAGSSLRCVVVGTITGTAGSKDIQLRAGGTNIGSVPFTTTAAGAFHAEICFRQLASGSQIVSGWGIAGATSAIGIADAGVGTAAITCGDGTSRAITCSVQLGNAADSVDVDLVELYRIN